MTDTASVVAVCARAAHDFTKETLPEIELLAGLGVAGDAHAGETVQHLYNIRQDPTRPNLRQVHLIHEELLDELKAAGFGVYPGAMGENVTTRGLDILSLPVGTRIGLGEEAVIEITGLRNPCKQLEAFETGLMGAVLDKTENGELIRKSGVMAIVVAGGRVRPGDSLNVVLPAPPFRPLEPV
jgi:MOSC domain-containing protein YiiM